MRILVITTLLPVSDIAAKKGENDILLVTEDEVKKYYPDVSFKYVFVFPYANKMLSFFSEKWKSYYNLKQRKRIIIKGRLISVLGLLMLPSKVRIREFFLFVGYWMNRRYIRQIIDDFQPTLIHAQTVDSAGYLARRIKRDYNIPYVLTLRGLNFSSDSPVISNLLQADTLIAVSKYQETQAYEISERKAAFIPHGVSDLFFEAVRSHEPTDILKLVSVCRLLPLKNIDLVIKTLSRIESEYIYDIYGDGPECQKISELITSLNLSHKIRLKGFTSNSSLPGILVNYDLFLMPSKPETLGRVYFEAMASGLPIVATKGTGVDGIIQDGREGFLVDLDNDGALLGILEGVFANPTILKEMGRNARKLVAEFTWANISHKLYSVYLNIRNANL